MKLEVSKASKFSGTFRPPSDKSLTHRAMMFAALASGESVIREPLRGEDPLSTLRCLNRLGVKHEWVSPQELRIQPPAEWSAPMEDLDCGNSGTTMRLMSGLLASRPFQCRLIGDASLSRRPMQRIADPLKLMGAQIEGTTPPLTIHGSATLSAIDYVSPIPSAQVKSCILLAGLRANGTTSVTEPALSRDHTERMLSALGVEVESDWLDTGGYRASVKPIRYLEPFEMAIPGDISSAAFFIVAAHLIPGSDLVLTQLGVNPSRLGIFEILDQTGAYYELVDQAPQLGEPVAELAIRYELGHAHRPLTIKGRLVPKLIDEIPILAVLATQLHGSSVISDADELRHKETDRIELMTRGLKSMGANIEATSDGMVIHGPTPLKGITVDSEGDHRIGMSFAIAGLIAEGTTTIDGADTIATSFPTFEADLRRLCHG